VTGINMKTLTITLNDDDQIVDVLLTDNSNAEVKPDYNYFFQDLIDDLNHEDILKATIAKYGDIDDRLFSAGL